MDTPIQTENPSEARTSVTRSTSEAVRKAAPALALKTGAPAEAETPKKAGGRFNKKWRWAIPVAIIALGFLGHWFYTLFTTESTDDAFVSDHVHVIGSRIAGTIIDVPVNDNQVVKKGDVLIRLDPKDFEVQDKIAKANAIKAHNDLGRWNEHEYLHPNEQLQRSADIAAALTADAALEQAELQLQYTTVVAPTNGKVGNRTVETGQQVQPGQALMALVEQTPWIVANFKESQVTHIRVGQKVAIEIDAIHDHKFTGTVESLAPGSGATFALLPPDNATGNFTKIVQRIPVKIVFDADSVRGYENRLAPGMSSEIVISTN